MDEETEQAVATTAGDVAISVDPDVINSEGLATDEGVYIVTNDGSTNENEVLLVIMSSDSTDTANAAESGIVAVESSDPATSDIVSNIISGDQVLVSEDGSSLVSSTGNQIIISGDMSGIGHMSTGSITSSSASTGGSIVVGEYSDPQTVVDAKRLTSILQTREQSMIQSKNSVNPMQVDNIVLESGSEEEGGDISSVPVTADYVLGRNVNIHGKGQKTVQATHSGGTTLGYTKISRNIGSQTPIATMTKKYVTVETQKKHVTVIPQKLPSSAPVAGSSKTIDSQSGEVVTTKRRIKVEDTSIEVEKSLDQDREKMAETADVLVELASGNQVVHKELTSHKKQMATLIGEDNSTTLNEAEKTRDGNNEMGEQSGTSESPAKQYKDMSREEEIEIILQEVENMCSKLVDYEEEFLVISINKTLRTRCLSSSVGKEFLDNNPDIVQRFLKFSYGKKPVEIAIKKEPDVQTPLRKSKRKRSVNPKFDSREFIMDSTRSNKRKKISEDLGIDESDIDSDDDEILTYSDSRSISGNLDVRLIHESQKVYSWTSQHSQKEFDLKDNEEEKGIFQCQVCKESFANASNLRRHKQKHTFGNAFPCESCDKRFSRKDILEVHMKVHTKKEVTDETETLTEVQNGVNESSLDFEIDEINDDSLLNENEALDATSFLDENNASQNEDFREAMKKNLRNIKVKNLKELTKRVKTLQKSWKEKKKSDLMFRCSICGVQCENLPKLRRHYDLHVECPYCKTRDFNQKTLAAHIRMVHPEIETGKRENCDGSEEQMTDEFLEEVKKAEGPRRISKRIQAKKDGADVKKSEEEFANDNVIDGSNRKQGLDGTSREKRTDGTSLENDVESSNIEKAPDGTPVEMEVDGTSVEKEEDSAFVEKETDDSNLVPDSEAEDAVYIPEDEEKIEEDNDNNREDYNDQGMTVAGGSSESKLSEVDVDILKDEDERETNEIDDEEDESQVEESKADDGLVICLEDLKRGKFPCRKCGRVFTNAQNLRRHYKIHTQMFEYECKICNKQFIRSDMFQKHLIVNHFAGSQDGCEPYYPYQCSVCGSKYTSKSVLNSHMKAKHSEGNDTVYYCDVCGKMFSQKSHLARHKIVHSRDRVLFKCDICQRNFKQKRSLEFHKCEVDGIQQVTVKKEGQFVCVKCGKSFDDNRKLNLHYRVHLNRQDDRTTDSLVCKICKREYANMSNLTKHMKFVHSNERKFVCKVCPKAFKTKDALIRHDIVHKDIDGSFSCEVCQKVLKTNESLKVHMKLHLGVKPYICDVCGMAFQQQGNLKKHLLIHSDEYNHRCDLCGKRFKSPETYKAHMRAHVIREGHPVQENYGKIYQCEYCGKKMATCTRYKIHLRTHTNEKPYICSFCNKAFHDPGKLKRHEKTHETFENDGVSTIQEIYVQHVPAELDGEEVTQVINLQDLPFLQTGSGVQEVTVQTAETNEAPTLTIYIDQEGL